MSRTKGPRPRPAGAVAATTRRAPAVTPPALVTALADADPEARDGVHARPGWTFLGRFSAAVRVGRVGLAPAP